MSIWYRAPVAEIKKVAPRVQAHVEKLRAAGLDTELFFDALVGIRDDHQLPDTHRTALYRLVATESFLWYLEALRGEPVDRSQLIAEAYEINARNSAAIKRRSPGDGAEALADAATRDPRPPKR